VDATGGSEASNSGKGVAPGLVSYMRNLIVAAGQSSGFTDDEIYTLVENSLGAVDLDTLLSSATSFADATDRLFEDGAVRELVGAAGLNVDAVAAHASSLADGGDGDDDAAATAVAAGLAMVAASIASAALF
jgi:hypothetical protein